jgi:hypothetical protein
MGQCRSILSTIAICIISESAAALLLFPARANCQQSGTKAPASTPLDAGVGNLKEEGDEAVQSKEYGAAVTRSLQAKKPVSMETWRLGLEFLFAGNLSNPSWGAGNGFSLTGGLHLFLLDPLLLRLSGGFQWIGPEGRFGGGKAFSGELLVTVRAARALAGRLLVSAGVATQYRYLWMESVHDLSVYAMGPTVYGLYFFSRRSAVSLDFTALPYFIVGVPDPSMGFEFIVRGGILVGL